MFGLVAVAVAGGLMVEKAGFEHQQGEKVVEEELEILLLQVY